MRMIASKFVVGCFLSAELAARLKRPSRLRLVLSAPVWNDVNLVYLHSYIIGVLRRRSGWRRDVSKESDDPLGTHRRIC